MPVIPTTIVVLLVGGYFLFRRTDVRLVLMLAAAVMFLVRSTQSDLAGASARVDAFARLFQEFAVQMISPNAVVPICSAMGFAYVCKLTECDAHLVHLLCRPLQKVKWLLIPGGVAVAFLINSAIVSQTSTVSVVGPVLIPLVMAAGISRQTAGAMLLLGGSMGGELLNPAAIEVTQIQKAVELTTRNPAVPNSVGTVLSNPQIIRAFMPYNLLACATALLVFWLLAVRFERRAKVEGIAEERGPDAGHGQSIAESMAAAGGACQVERINVFKATVPLVPILLLMFVAPWLEHHQWMPIFDPPVKEQAPIAAAMLIGVVCATLASGSRAGKIATAFFEGAGFAYVHVISVIIAANVFSASLKANGLIDMLASHVKDAPTMVVVMGIVLPWVMAAITGTAVGTAPAVINVLVPVAMGGLAKDAAARQGVHVGGVAAITAQFGRTSSPVAPVVIMCATLAQSRPLTLVKRVLLPLLAGGGALLIAALAHLF
jgi:DcuC family C4-dicarboxylate transporter